MFLSYSRRDSAAVDMVADRLRREGLDVWIDRTGIDGGDQWRREIVQAIETAAAFVLLLSINSVRSSNVRKELDLADGQAPILPVMLGPADIPDTMKYSLAGMQTIALSPDLDRGVAELVHALRRKGVRAEADGHGVTSPQRRPAGAGGKPRAAVDLSELGGSRLLDKLSVRKLLWWR